MSYEKERRVDPATRQVAAGLRQNTASTSQLLWHHEHPPLPPRGLSQRDYFRLRQRAYVKNLETVVKTEGLVGGAARIKARRSLSFDRSSVRRRVPAVTERTVAAGGPITCPGWERDVTYTTVDGQNTIFHLEARPRGEQDPTAAPAPVDVM